MKRDDPGFWLDVLTTAAIVLIVIVVSQWVADVLATR